MKLGYDKAFNGMAFDHRAPFSTDLRTTAPLSPELEAKLLEIALG
jgi:hypothetical protein